MIEIINNCLGGFITALVIYSLFSKRAWIDLAVLTTSLVYLIYLIGFKLGTGDLVSAIFPFVVLLAFIGTIIWRLKKAPEETEERAYTREELITAQYIYDRNYIQDPEGFAQLRGTRKHAEVTINYILGIIEGDGENYKTMTYESKINGKKTALRTE